MENSEHYTALISIIRGHLGPDAGEITPDTAINAVPGWDSLQMVNIIISIQKKFSIKIKPKALNKVDKISDLLCVIEDQLPA